MPPEFDAQPYKFDTAGLLTPALVIYPQMVGRNIARMIDVLGGDADRWRPHLKTVKVAEMMRLLVQAGVSCAKCATTLELLVACQVGFGDVLVAFSHSGANANRVARIAAEYPGVRVSTVIEHASQIENWRNTVVGIFVDINPGMDRTGIQRTQVCEIVEQARNIRGAGLEFRGLHFYDGNSTEEDLDRRTQAAHRRYDDLMTIVSAVEAGGIEVREVVTSGTPALPCALSYSPFSTASFRHRVSPGTVVYNDVSSLKQLPGEYGFCPAVVVVSRVVSHPRLGVITCDAGHKSVSVDSGVPNCVVLGHPKFVPLKPSEEHLPIEVPQDLPAPALGSVLYLVPRHVCPTVNSANFAVLVEGGVASAITAVTARGHEYSLQRASPRPRDRRGQFQRL